MRMVKTADLLVSRRMTEGAHRTRIGVTSERGCSVFLLGFPEQSDGTIYCARDLAARIRLKALHVRLCPAKPSGWETLSRPLPPSWLQAEAAPTRFPAELAPHRATNPSAMMGRDCFRC